MVGTILHPILLLLAPLFKLYFAFKKDHNQSEGQNFSGNGVDVDLLSWTENEYFQFTLVFFLFTSVLEMHYTLYSILSAHANYILPLLVLVQLCYFKR